MKGCIKTEGGKSAYYIDGVKVSKAAFYKTFRPKLTPATALEKAGLVKKGKGWPLKSKALAVHPKQVAEANERNRKHGVNVQYAADGHAILPDRNERRKLLRLEGMHDHHGGYSD